MKNEEMLKLIGQIDDKLVDEASPMNTEIVKKMDRIRKNKRFTLMAACVACLVVIASLWLFVPFNSAPPSVSQYKNSEYYDLICMINKMTYEKPKYKNNFEMLVSIFTPPVKHDANFAPSDSGPIGTYEEVTDNQVEGVIEADLFKRSDEYIYYLKSNLLEIYSIAAEESARVAFYDLDNEMVEILQEDVKAHQIVLDIKGIYLSSDCKTLTVLCSNGYAGSYDAMTLVVTYDVTNPKNIRKIGYACVSGVYQSSRMIDGQLILLTHKVVTGNTNFSNDKTYLPYTYDGNGYDILTPKEIISAQNPGQPSYTVICKLSERDLEVLDRIAYFSYASDEYITKDNVYVTFEYQTEDQKWNITNREDKTEISCLGIADEFKHKGTVTVNGSILDQYSMDEYDGVFRVVSATLLSKNKNGFGNRTDTISTSRNADLYCIDATTFEIISAVRSFAPEGEVVRSVRFDKTAAYVCTSIQILTQNTDPVFFFDLSDLNNITYTDTGTIPGFSTSLINMGDGYLLGIGEGDSRNDVKIEVYKQGEGRVDSVCSYTVRNAIYSIDYKAYFIDREKGLVGLAVRYFSGGYERYLLLEFKNETLTPLKEAYIDAYYPGLVRATLIDGYFYILSSGQILVQMLPEEYIK